MSQRAILTFEDSEDDQVKINLTFDPPIKGDAEMTPSIHMAMQALGVLQRNNAACDEDDA